jgi:hypothetical protein
MYVTNQSQINKKFVKSSKKKLLPKGAKVVLFYQKCVVVHVRGGSLKFIYNEMNFY